jgi:hypothetical protein
VFGGGKGNRHSGLGKGKFSKSIATYLTMDQPDILVALPTRFRGFWGFKAALRGYFVSFKGVFGVFQRRCAACTLEIPCFHVFS